MTDTSSLSHLIERLEKAAVGSPELDEDIALAIGWTNDIWMRALQWTSPDGTVSRSSPPKFSSSIDAARSLGGMCVFASDIGADGLPMVKIVVDTTPTPIIDFTGIAATLELAWCSAALKAQLSTRTNEQDNARNLSGVSSE